MSSDPGNASAHPPPSQTGNPFSGFPKKTYRLKELFRDLAALVPRLPGIYSIWVRKRVPPRFREEIMVAVARTNECRFCNFIHGQWALSEGLSQDELERIGMANGPGADPAHSLALSYVQALASAGFGPVPEELAKEMRAVYNETQIRDLDTVARVMTLANLSANTLDALLSRRKGNPSGHSRPVDELVIGAGFFLVYPLMMVVLAVMQRRSPLSVYRDFVQSQQPQETS